MQGKKAEGLRQGAARRTLIPASLGGEFLAVEDRERRVQIRDEIARILEPGREAQSPSVTPNAAFASGVSL